MSLDKAIKHNKEYRKQYYGAKSCDKSCRNHGSDDWSLRNRMYQTNKLKEKEKQELQNVEWYT